VALAILVSGCEVDATVAITVHPNGHGVVRVVVTADAEAVAALEAGGKSLATATRLGDLTAADWAVGEWTKKTDGSAAIVLTHKFDSVDQVGPLVTELNGEFGPVKKLRVVKNKSLIGTEYSVSGELIKPRTGIAEDTEIAANLSKLGIDQAVIDKQLLDQVDSAFSLTIITHLPDGETTIIKAKTRATRTPFDVSALVVDTVRLVWLGAAFILLLLAIYLFLTRGRSRRARPIRRASQRRNGRRGSQPALRTDRNTGNQ